MYAQRHFRETDSEILAATIRSIGAISLVTSAPGGLMSTFAPVLVEGDAEHPVLVGHIAKANPQWRDTDSSCPAMAIAIGANGYISPNWYPSKRWDPKVVPTWNHVHVQAHGRIEFLPDRDDCRQIVTALTELHEAHRPEPWSIDDAPDDFVDSKLAAIVGFRLRVDRLEGMFKMSQNLSAENRGGVVDALGTANEVARIMSESRAV